ncbi:MAG: hypothetical protein IJH32_03655 [Ruminococcus sp.]|nr:hypothetical protein [Ruminococcus sp.]
MKKLLSLLLALTLVFSVCSFAAFADGGDPEDSGEPGPEYGDFVSLMYTNEDGTPAYQVDPEWGAVLIQQQVIYDRFSDKAEEIEGVTYYPATSTLVIDNLQAADRILHAGFMLDTLNLCVRGDCSLGRIEGEGSSLHIYGTGSLTVNENLLYDTAVDLNSQGKDISLSFGTDVTATLYAGDDNRIGSAVIINAKGETPADRITFDGVHNGALSEGYNEREESLWLEGYRKVYEEPRAYLGDRLISKSDPDGFYVGQQFAEAEGDEGIIIRKLVYVESLGGYLPDPSFSEDIYETLYGTSMYMDEFESEDCDYSFAYDGDGDTIPVYNPFWFSGYAYLPVVTDGKGNFYVTSSVYDPETGTSANVYGTYEEIDGMDGLCLFKPAEGVSGEGFEYVYDDGGQVCLTGFVLEEPENISRLAEKVTCASDPDGLYAYTGRWDPERGEYHAVVRFLYDEACGIYVDDDSFEEVIVEDESFFDSGDYQRVKDEWGYPLCYEYNGFRVDRVSGPGYQDEEGNRYMVERFYDGEKEEIHIYSYEPISVSEDRYLFTEADHVDPDKLTVVEELVPVKDEKNFVLKADDGVFVYNGRQTGDTFSISGKVITYLKERGDHAEVKLYRAGEEEPLASQVMDSCEAPYLFEGLTAGSYVLSVDKAYHVSRSFEVTLSADTALELKINPLGDFTLDGKVNIRDVNAAYNHVKGNPTVTDEYAIKCGDVARHDNQVNIRDVNTLYNHVKGNTSIYQ